VKDTSYTQVLGGGGQSIALLTYFQDSPARPSGKNGLKQK
jgi:hypothetical protein